MVGQFSMNERAKREWSMRVLLGNEVYEAKKELLKDADAVQEAARFVRQMRKHANITQTELADRLSVSQARVSEIERGGSPEGISYMLLRRVARVCGFADWPPSPLEETAWKEGRILEAAAGAVAEE
ncbi:MAG TPA: helix-turn-helix transcriptional regulator [Rhizomicrobium sp.]|jgi:DNA-binding transcriptional regulator YiaG